MAASVVSVCVVGEWKGATTQTALNLWHRHRSASTTENGDGLICLNALQSSHTMAVQSDLICVSGFTCFPYIIFLIEAKEWNALKVQIKGKIKMEKGEHKPDQYSACMSESSLKTPGGRLWCERVGEQSFRVNWSIKVMTVPKVFVGQLYSNSWLLTALYSL